VLRLDPGSAASADPVIRKALRTATAERPGAVHLTVTADTWDLPAGNDEVVVPPLGPAAGTVAVYGEGDPLRALRAARRPVILAGIAAVRCAAGPELVRLAELAGIPVRRPRRDRGEAVLAGPAGGRPGRRRRVRDDRHRAADRRGAAPARGRRGLRRREGA
jgi:hypothetical protein